MGCDNRCSEEGNRHFGYEHCNLCPGRDDGSSYDTRKSDWFKDSIENVCERCVDFTTPLDKAPCRRCIHVLRRDWKENPSGKDTGNPVQDEFMELPPELY